MNFVVIDTFDSFIEAHIIMGRLEEENINCWLKDENIVTINPILSNAVGGIKLMVAESQAQRAQDLINHFRQQRKEQLSCPKCHSNNIEQVNNPKKAMNWVVAITTWFMGSYAVGVEKVWHCFNCGNEFDEPVEVCNEYVELEQ